MRVKQLEERLEELEAQLGQQEDEAEDAIAKWQESYSALEGQCGELTKELETSRQKEGTLQMQLAETVKALDEARDHLKDDEDVVNKWQGELFLLVRGIFCRSNCA